MFENCWFITGTAYAGKSTMEYFRQYLMRMNSPERNQRYRDAGFPVLERDDRRSIAETVQLAAQMLGLVPC